VAINPDGTRIVTASWDKTAKVWDARTGTTTLDLKGHTGVVSSVAFSLDGTRIVTGSADRTENVWDARTGQELKGETVRKIPRTGPISPDGRLIARVAGNHVELITLQPDEEELAYRRFHTQPNLWRYREGYESARKANDDFAARFYLSLLPQPEQKVLEAEAAAEWQIAAGRTEDALAHLVTVSIAKPEDTSLALKLAALQAWFGRDKELALTRGRALEFAKTSFSPEDWDRTVRICTLRPTQDKARLEPALTLARKAVEINKNAFTYRLTLGMAEWRCDHFVEADAALFAAAEAGKNNPHVTSMSAFYRAVSLFRQGKEDEARRLAAEAASKMKPLPSDKRNPLAGGANTEDLILWLAHTEAKELIKFDVSPAQPDVK
jgi:Flp pilus assembly protein TadD